MANLLPVSIAYTPDSDDAFYYYAMEKGIIPVPGMKVRYVSDCIHSLNQLARKETYDITAISSVLYPGIADKYAILSVGTSVGRGYGPVLVSKNIQRHEDLAGKRVGIPGATTTGGYLLRLLCPDAVRIEMPFDAIARAVVSGEVDAGVMIHEELLYYPQLGLHPLTDLGGEWCQRQGLPLPVGLNVIRRGLGKPMMERICSIIRKSLEYGLAHQEESLAWVSRYGRGEAGQCTRKFVGMFANEDSLCMPEDVRAGLTVLLNQVVDLGGSEPISQIDIIEGQPARSRIAG